MAEPFFNQFILKIHGCCDPARGQAGGVDRAYLDGHLDDPEEHGRPACMADRTICTVAERIAEHAERHQLDRVTVVLRGGEPLLMGPSGLRWTFRTIRAALAGVADVELSVQTGGGHLDERFAELFLANNVQVAVALDGGRTASARNHRLGNGGRGYDAVARAVQLLGSPDYRPAFAGLLCTVDVANEPVRLFEDLAALDPPAIELLLPHASWEHPPPAASLGRTPYGDWLIRVFDHWYDAPPRVGIRLFEEAIHALLGGVGRRDETGQSARQSIAIGTDGSIDRTDALRLAGGGPVTTGHTVFEHSFDDVLRHVPALADSGADAITLSATCRSCSIVSTCGGGLYAHRYQVGTDFDNPSVYCRDLTALITHIKTRITADLAAANVSVRATAEAGIVRQAQPSDLVDIR